MVNFATEMVVNFNRNIQPDYKIYVEYFGQWGVEEQKERYREKKQVYVANHIPCVILYPENLGIIDYIFEKRILYVLKRYKLEKELKKYRISLFLKDRKSNIAYIIFGFGAVALSYPWHKDRLWLFAGIVIILYQLYLMNMSYKSIFNDEPLD